MQPIFVGDVQGCAEELGELIARAEAEYAKEFTLWVVGDLVNRGPDNRRALELVRGLVEEGRGEYVLGNHEIHLIATALGLRELGPWDSVGDLLSASDAQEWIDWLRRRPLAVGGVLAGRRFVMVHASVAPDWSYEEVLAHADRAAAHLAESRASAREFLSQDEGESEARDDLGRLTRCRSIAPGFVWSSRPPEGEARPWHAVWAEREHDYGVVYGHWALQGLHLGRGLRGLDTGCVHHGRGRKGLLTAWLPDAEDVSRSGGAFGLPDDRFWQIAARRRYYNRPSRG
ncbi:MAG: metallophosphoesterase [Deltaproteobacteria bacterium]|jgi:bis(5'-nucleosyl)-tetraphosphatase (symmetrical)|nr:metallophosphoesterase [Deltaproteobacteria bacterium]